MAFDVWNNWMLMAFLNPALWAITCIVDVCLVGERIFRYPSDGAIISCLFCILPALVFVTDVGGWDAISLEASVPALLAGVCFFAHIHFYFKALLVLNDASSAELFSNLSILIVPVLAYFLLGERLMPIYCLAISLAFGGILVLIRRHLHRAGKQAVMSLALSVIFISLSMVLQAWVFERMNYWNGVILFSVASFLTAVVVAGAQRERRRRIAGLCRRFAGIFLIAELLQLAALLASQRATAVGPSVSLVALVECALPLFVVAFSLGAVGMSRYCKSISVKMRDALALQTAALPAKTLSFTLIGIAILLVEFDGV